MRCYAMAVPVIVWAILLQTHLVTDDASRVPYLVVQGVAIIISVNGLHARYRDQRRP